MVLAMTGTAVSRSASPKITCGDLPPSSSVQPMWFRAAAVWMSVLTSGLPVKEMKSMPGWEERAAPASSPKPGTTLTAPSGKPASAASSASRSGVRQASSAGLTTAALPIARAGATVRPNIWAG